jgi:trans-aconitate 2-methyltransferase
MQWDVSQYHRFKDERARPFHELVNRIGPRPVHRFADLGCGTGELTETLLQRWPGARGFGVDNSPDMLKSATQRPAVAGLEYIQADIELWEPPEPLDLVVSNATVQWIPDQERMLGHMAKILLPTGTLAVQMPRNFHAPSHVLVAKALEREPWRSRITAVMPRMPPEPHWYITQLWKLGFPEVDAWTTSYEHILQGNDAVLEWLKGTTLRPMLSQLDGADKERFLEEVAGPLQEAYPRGENGTILSFRRLFFVAHRF